MKKQHTAKKEKWLTENHKGFLRTGFKYKKSLFDKNSAFQNVQVIETQGFGRMLVNEGIVMTCERDEFVYHEMIAHVPLFSHPAPREVLIIGGGDGGTAREVLRHKEVKRCVMVEIDPLVVSACKKHLKKTACAFDDPRLDLRIEDGARYAAHCKKESFDVMAVDSSDPIGPSSVLFGEDFYKNASRILKKDGILTAQAGNMFYDTEDQKLRLKSLKTIFKACGFYNYSNLTYPAGLWSFLFASKGPHPLKDFSAKRLKGLSFKYYNEQIHRSAFALPQFARSSFAEFWTI